MEYCIPVGTFEAMFERIRTTREKSATPPALFIFEYGSTESHSALGMPVLLNPSTVINIPQKNINKEYETCYIELQTLDENKNVIAFTSPTCTPILVH
jgi:hypothetical protein